MINLILPYGKSFLGVCQDALSYLAALGDNAGRIVVLLGERDFVPEVEGPIEFVYKIPNDLIGKIYVVVNGGTTPQQFTIVQHFMQEYCNNEVHNVFCSYGLEGHHPSDKRDFQPVTFLNVQKDGVTVLCTLS